VSADHELYEALMARWTERSSVRAFRPEAIERETLVELFAAGQRAPSWCNVQPWRVYVTEPPFTNTLATEMVTAAKSGMPHAEVPFPLDYPSPYKERRNACGAALYTAMGIARDNKMGRYDAWLRNYGFFDAPHLAVVAVDRRLGPYVYIDVGVWLGYVMTAAAALGIDNCPMASVAAYPEALRARLPIGETETVLFGIALGRADEAAPANRARTTRDPVETNVTFVTATPPG
jgi:nitroreductase